MSFLVNLKESKLETIFHLINIFAWILQIAGLGSLGTSITKNLVLYIFVSIFAFLASIIMIVIIGLSNITHEALHIFNFVSAMIIAISLIGANNVYSSYCLSAEKCHNSTKVYVSGVSISVCALITLFFLNSQKDIFENPNSSDSISRDFYVEQNDNNQNQEPRFQIDSKSETTSEKSDESTEDSN
ncbi:hypothetical protein M0811_08877 [Anaeramoeba ignava]|uniref:Uncharacterized protein n=1 Tax=Anaeramoeba ignava TaxID=1746090 RepID=A0A9Q0LIP7_ANAIG|nr:hypothetical protein M0811_08877 [Anaeramoeba ignava]